MDQRINSTWITKDIAMSSHEEELHISESQDKVAVLFKNVIKETYMA